MIALPAQTKGAENVLFRVLSNTCTKLVWKCSNFRYFLYAIPPLMAAVKQYPEYRELILTPGLYIQLTHILLRDFLQYSRYPHPKGNAAPPQFSVLGISFCEVFLLHPSTVP
jgi:hypothetical protein